MYSGEFDVKKCKECDEYLCDKFKFIKRSVIGETVCSRDIVAYTIGGENGVLMCGAFHGMERITAAVLYKFLDEVCTSSIKNKRLYNALKRTGLTAIPMINPDGVEISIHGADTAKSCALHVKECLKKAKADHTRWQANARGVDINHNFDADFKSVKENEVKMGILSPAPTRYGGKMAESENETKALCDLCRSRAYSCAVALHSQGREIYYDFGDCTPKESLSVAKAMAKLSGYKVAYPQGIAVGGGFKDWFIQQFKRSGFTFEIGEGVNPLPPAIFDTEYIRVSKMLWYLLNFYAK